MDMPLTMAASGEINTVKRIQGRDETKRFLASLGFVEGGQVQVISEISGNLIVNIKDTRIALSKSMANRIMI
jgi:ferrous iron transport protein A